MSLVENNLVSKKRKRLSYTNEFKIACVDGLVNFGWSYVEETHGIIKSLVYKWEY